MPLRRIVSDLDDLSEGQRALYVKQDDGRYRLDIEEDDQDRGLRHARDNEKRKRKEVEEKLRAQSERFEGIDDVDLVRKLLEEHQKGQRKKMIDEDRVEEYVEQATAQRVTKMKETYEEEKRAILKERDEARGLLTEVMVDNIWPVEAAKMGLNIEPSALPDLVHRGRERFQYDFETKQLVAHNGDEVIFGKDGENSQTPAEFLEELKNTAKHLFLPSNGSGATKTIQSIGSRAAPKKKLFGYEKIRDARGLS